MIRNTALGAALVALSVLAGCDKSPGEAQNAARDEQRRADEEANTARQHAAEIAASAQAKANDAATHADQVLTQARADARASAQKDLDDLSAQIDDLQLKASKAKGQAKVNMETTLKTLDEERAAVRRDIATLEKSTTSDFEAAKAQVQKSLGSLKRSLSAAASKI